MAKKSQKSRKSSGKPAVEETVVDAEVVEDIHDADVATPEDLERALSEDIDAAATEAEDTVVETPDAQEDTPAEIEASPEQEPDSPEIEPETAVVEPESAPAPLPQPAPAKQSSGFFPMLLGGIVAGVIGYGFAYMQFANQSPAASVADLTALENQVAELPPPTDITGLTTQIETLQSDIAELGNRFDGTMTDMDANVTDLVARIEVLERQPNADGTLTDTAMAAFESDMATLREQLEGMTSQTSEELAAAQAAAAEVQANAVEAARRATGRAALARVQGALQTGEPFAALLPELESALGADTPDAIAAVAEGVPTLNALQTALPDAARAALSTARAEGVDGEDGGGLGSFLRTQLNARSIQPQEGDGVDAVLSRVEAAMAEGRLNDALAEADALPDVAKSALSDWLAQAEARAAAVDAAETLATSLSD